MPLNGKFHFLFSFVVIFLIAIVLNQNAFAAVPTVVSAQITGGNTITIVYSEPVFSTLVDYSDLQLTAGGPRIPLLVLGTGTDTITITFSGGAVNIDETGSIDIAATLISVSTLSPIVPLNDLFLGDGQPGSTQVSDTVRSINDKFRTLTPARVSFSETDIFSGQSITSNSYKGDTNTVKVNEPTSIAIEFPEHSVDYLDEIGIYLNLRDSKFKIYDSDTYVEYNRFGPLEIKDENKLFSNVDVKISKLDKKVKYEFELSFAKEMDESNLILQYIDRLRNYRIFNFPDAIHVVGDNIAENTPFDEEPVVKKLDRFQQVLKNNLDNGQNIAPLYDKTIDLPWYTVIRTQEALDNTLEKTIFANPIDELSELENESSVENMFEFNEELSNLKLETNSDWDKWNVNGISLDPRIYQLIQSQNPENDAASLGLLYDNGKTNLIIETEELDENSLSKIRSLGLTSIELNNHIQLCMNYYKLAKLYSIEGIKKIRAPFTPIPYAVSDSNLKIINVNDDYSKDLTGKNIKVAVIDIAFDLENTKISKNIVDSKSFRFGISEKAIPVYGIGKENVHGTAVTELIIDVAPQTSLYLYTMGNDLEFVEALSEAVKNNVDIIVIPLGWPNLPTDGSSNITQAINQISENGQITVLPAGNFGQKHWESSFKDSNINGWNEFGDNDEGLTFKITQDRIRKNTPIAINLLWENNFLDFDMALIGPSNKIVKYSTNEQKTEDDLPYEQIIYYPEKPGTYSLGIKFNGEAPTNEKLELFSINDSLEHVTPDGSVTVPTDANGVLVVGSVIPGTNSLEPFSSQGPTNHGSLVPHMLAPGSGSTLSTGDNLFQGTSASVPYLGGIVARILESNPELTSDQILDLIRS